MKQFLGLALCVLMLAGCAVIPRGAGLQSEVLSAQDQTDAQGRPEFTIEVVTRDNLAVFASWPTINAESFRWINRLDQPNSRIIAPGDKVTVTLWSTEENGLLMSPGQRFTTLPEMQVSSGGTVFLPYIGSQRISGMSPERARERIQEEYLAVSPSVQTQLSLVEGRGRTVSLVGGVGAPGAYPLADNDVTILQMISQAGGISAALNNPQVRLQRNGSMYGVSADRLLNSPQLDTTLEGGDKIFIETDDRSFLSLGAAGSEAVHPFPKDHLSALEALSIIGGVSDTRADAKGILILRRYPANTITADRRGPDHPRTVFTLDLTTADGLFSADQFAIENGDLVYVTESPLTAATSILTAIRSAFGLASLI